MIPSYPLRPTNGGPFKPDRDKRGQWAYEPKVNGWRAIVHAPTSRMWNRRGQRLSIEYEFAAVLEAIRNADLPPEMEWLDCEAFERRHALGKGSLVLLDYIPTDKATYGERQERILDAVRTGLPVIRHFTHLKPPEEDRLLLLDKYLPHNTTSEVKIGARVEPSFDLYDMWGVLQYMNNQWNAEVFEGFVAKRIDSPYPRQLRSPNQETPYWVKHRWDF